MFNHSCVRSWAKVVLLMSVIISALTGCGDQGPTPPVARIQPHAMTIHDHTRVDDYYWLNDRENPQVIAYLNAENAYLKAAMKGTEKLQQELFAEMKGRIKKDDASAPVEKDGYWYYTRYITGGEYPLHCRRPENMDGVFNPPEQERQIF